MFEIMKTVIAAFLFSIFMINPISANEAQEKGELGFNLDSSHYQEGKLPDGWRLREIPGARNRINAKWVIEEGMEAVELKSDNSLVFLEKKVSIDLKEYPIVTWTWKVENILEGNDERSVKGDDHPIRLFFVLEPDETKQSFWMKAKRFFLLDLIHGHPVGGRFTEYLWSSTFQPDEIINDPSKPAQKLIVIEGGKEKLGKWLSYERNLYEDFKSLYGEEPRKLVFIGILNDTDQTGQSATSYLAHFSFRNRMSMRIENR